MFKTKSKKKIFIIVGIIAAIVLVAAILVGIVLSRINSAMNMMTDYGLLAYVVEEQDLSETVSTSGTVTSASVYEVTTEVTSPIKELNVSLGDQVEAGQVLMTFDDQELREQIAELEAADAQAKKSINGTISRAQRDYNQAVANRDEYLNQYNYYKNLAISQYNQGNASWEATDATATEYYQRYEEAQNSLQGYADAVDQANESVDTSPNTELNKLRRQLENLTVVSEQSGIVTQLNVSKGSTPNGTMLKIEDPNALKVTVNVKEKDVLKLVVGQTASVTSDSLGSDQVFNGTVEKVINFATSEGSSGLDGGDSSSGYTATIAVDPGANLLLGMKVKVNIAVTDEGSAIAVPYDAILSENGSDYVYKGIMNDDGTFNLSKVSVTQGTTNDYYVAISGSEIAAGDIIVAYPDGVTETENVMLDIMTSDGTFEASSEDMEEY